MPTARLEIPVKSKPNGSRPIFNIFAVIEGGSLIRRGLG